LEILINEEKVDYTLENEKNLGEVITSLENWLQNSGFIITSIKRDTLELLTDKRSDWETTAIADIEKLALTAKTVNELHISTCENVIAFLSLLKRAVEQADHGLLSELSTGFPFVVESLRLVFSNNRLIPIANEIRDFEALKPLLSLEGLSPENAKSETETIERLYDKVTILIYELKYPSDALKNITSDLKASIKDISDVSILLQTGKDRKAFDSIIHFSELFQSFLRVFTYLKSIKKLELSSYKIGDISLDEYYNNLNGILEELHNAFTINDFVLIGDLLEYEIAPKTTVLIDFLDTLNLSDTKS
jgi:hypothetical protein